MGPKKTSSGISRKWTMKTRKRFSSIRTRAHLGSTSAKTNTLLRSGTESQKFFPTWAAVPDSVRNPWNFHWHTQVAGANNPPVPTHVMTFVARIIQSLSDVVLLLKKEPNLRAQLNSKLAMKPCAIHKYNYRPLSSFIAGSM